MTDQDSPQKRRLPIPFRNTIEKAVEHFSFAERLILYVLATIMVVSATILVFRLNDLFLVEVPARGGSLTEGILGTPSLINPLLAISDADRDLTSLIYSGLMKATANGTLIPDLAESYSISDDGLTYSFILKDNLSWSDGSSLTTDDIEYTILKAQDPAVRSPKRANWDSVKVQKVNEREITFTLKQPYSPFLENTTLGILPKHIWKDVTPGEFPLSYFNIEPIGSGPFQVSKMRRNSSGFPAEYNLESFSEYALGKPYLSKLNFVFYPNEKDLLENFKTGTIESVNSITPKEVGGLQSETSQILSTPLSRVFGVFFNQNDNSVFADPAVRRALDMSIDKEYIVTEVLSGFGVGTDGPVPPGFLNNTARAPIGSSTETLTVLEGTSTENVPLPIARGRTILEKAGWELSPEGVYQKPDKKKPAKGASAKPPQILSFSLTTSNAPELKKTAEILKETWEKLGARVDLQVFEPGELSQSIIRPRKYNALLFGEIVGRDLDLFAFWHSSQRNDPGLNIALYTNTKADKLLSEARTMQNRDERLAKYQEFTEIIAAETPAVFLYSPTFIYITPTELRGVELGHITVPSERFLTIHKWYTQTEKVWKIFINNKHY